MFSIMDKTFQKMDETFDEMGRTFDEMFKSTEEIANTILSFTGPLPSFPLVNVFAFANPTNANKNNPTLTDVVVELALSGYKSDDVDVSVQQINGVNFLTIESKGINDRIGSDVKWYNRGIAGRAFKMSFMIANNVKVKEAELKDGLLSIRLSIDGPLDVHTIQKVSLKKKSSPTPASGVSSSPGYAGDPPGTFGGSDF